MNPEPHPQSSRRHFLRQLTAVSTAATTGASSATNGAGVSGNGGPPPDLPRLVEPTGGDLGSMYWDLEKLATLNRFQYSFLGDRFKTVEQFKQSGRDKIFEVFAYRPEQVDPRPEIVDRRDAGDHMREKVVFSTSPHFRVPAYVLVPKGLKRPAPAVVDLHSHGGMYVFGKEKVIDLGANHPVMAPYHQKHYEGRPTATELVRRGYVVIAIDAFMFGERRLLLDGDLKYGWDRYRYSAEDVAYLNDKSRLKEVTLVKSLILAGQSWPGIVAWDDIRTVDYLVTRPEVDASRIGCSGVSLGGYRALYLAALDKRIKAACLVGFMSTVGAMLRAKIDTHSFVHFLPGLHPWLDLPDVAALHAPNPLMVAQCRRDHLFTLEGMEESLRQIEAAYAKAGVADRFVGRMFDAPHQFSRTIQDEAFAFFDRHLKAN